MPILLSRMLRPKTRVSSFTLQPTHEEILVPLPSECTPNQISHHHVAIDLIQGTSISYLSWCRSFLTVLSTSTLDLTSFSLHSSQRSFKTQSDHFLPKTSNGFTPHSGQNQGPVQRDLAPHYLSHPISTALLLTSTPQPS